MARDGTVPGSHPMNKTANEITVRGQKGWSAFLTRHSLPRRLQLASACKNIEQLVMPVARAIDKDEDFLLTWKNGDWR